MTPPRAARSPFTLLTPIVIGVVVASAAVIFLVFLVIPSRGKVQTDAQRPDAPAINAPGVSELPKPKQEGHPINRINEPLFVDPTSTPEDLAMVEPTKRPTKTPTEDVVVEFSSTPRVIRTPTPTYAAPVIIEQPTMVWVPTEAPPPVQPPPPAATDTPPPAPTATKVPPTIAPEPTRTPAPPPPPPATATPAPPAPTADPTSPTLPPVDPTPTVSASVTPTATVPIIEGPPVTETPTDLTVTPGTTDTPTATSTPKSKKKRTPTATPDVSPSSEATPAN